MKVTLREQLTDDVRVIMEIADELLGERVKDIPFAVITQESYFKFLEVIETHLHYCLDNYKFAEDERKEEMLPT